MAWVTALRDSVCELRASWYPPLLPGLVRTKPALVSRFSTCLRNGTSASIRRPNSAAFIHSCDPCPVSSTSASTASLLVLLISISSTFLDTLINISHLQRPPQVKSGPSQRAGKSASILAFGALFMEPTKQLERLEFYIQSPRLQKNLESLFHSGSPGSSACAGTQRAPETATSTACRCSPISPSGSRDVHHI